MSQTQYIPVSCNRDCITGCPLTAEVRDGRVVRITNSPYKSQYMNGCARGFLFHKVLYHPDRITRPLIRTGERGEGKFRTAGWDEALDHVAENLRSTVERHGYGSIMLIGGSGACRGAFHNTALVPQRFLSLFGGFTNTAGTYSSQAVDFIKPYMYGTRYVGIDVKTLLHSKLVVLWGFNAADTRFGAETESILSEVKRRGIPIIVIDPRRTRTVQRYADDWLPVLPGSDSALMLAVLHVILSSRLENRDFIERYSTGFSELERYIIGLDDGQPKTPAWAAVRCGLPAGRITKFALRYAGSHPAALLPGLSIQRTLGGEEADRLGGVLQLVLGNVGIAGGSSGSGQWNMLPTPPFGQLPVPENPIGTEVPVYQWADAVLEGRQNGWPSDIRFLYNVGGNYILQGSDTGKNIRAFSKADFVVTHDYFLTDTARFSDVVLPVTTFLERRDILRTSMNYLFLSEKAVEPSGESRNDWDIFACLAERLGFGEKFTENMDPDQWFMKLLAQCGLEREEEFMRTGVYAGPDQERVGLSDFIMDPEKKPLSTGSGRIEISIPELETFGGHRIPVWTEIPSLPEYPLFLITPHERMRNNSQFSNIEEFQGRIDKTLWINPEDAEARRIRGGEQVILTSPEGKACFTARVTSDIMPGVISCSQGEWLSADYNRSSAAMAKDLQRSSAESSAVNMVTSTVPTLPSSGARTHSTKVEVCLKDLLPAG